MPDVLRQAGRRRSGDEQVTIATLVATRRSQSPPVGAKIAVFDEDGVFSPVSGGRVEADAAERAQELIRGAGPRLPSHGIDDETAIAVDPCGGEIDSFVERFD